jgi:hypothetical protein
MPSCVSPANGTYAAVFCITPAGHKRTHLVTPRRRRFIALVILLTGLALTGCGEKPQDYGFAIDNVSVVRGYQSLSVRLTPELVLSSEALSALQHGVTLIIRLDLELRNDNNMIVVRRETRRFQVSYLPLSERYQLKNPDDAKLVTYSRLRHVFAAIGDTEINLATGPLPLGNYELRTRIQLDENLLPAPMQLPVMFSSQWRHDSEWSVWPFKVSV